MKEGMLWDLIDSLCNKEEKHLFISMKEDKYSTLEEYYNELISSLKEALDELQQ